MLTLQKRIILGMERAGIGQAELARRLHIKQPSVHALLNGTADRTKYIIDIARVLGLRPEWLQYGEGPMTDIPLEFQVPEADVASMERVGPLRDEMIAGGIYRKNEEGALSHAGVCVRRRGSGQARHVFSTRVGEQDELKLYVDVGGTEYAVIPRFDTSLSAGDGSLAAPHAEVQGYQLIEAQWLRAITQSKAEHLAIVRVTGDSMEPTLQDGDWVLVDRKQVDIAKEGIYALSVGDITWIKRVTLNLKNHLIRIISDNNVYPMQEVAEGDISIAGRVVWIVGRKI